MKKTREIVQKEALEALKKNNYNGTICLQTGSGKSKVAIDAIKQGNFKNILIVSPRQNLKENWRNELEKWGLRSYEDSNEGKDCYWYIKEVLLNYHKINIIIENIQTAYKFLESDIDEYDLIIYDEIHTCGEEYFRLLDLAMCPVIGLTATPNKSDEWKKEVLYKKVPIIYEYYEAEKDGLVNKTKYWVYEYELDNFHKVQVGTKTKKWYVGEANQYNYLTEQYLKAKKLMFDVDADNYFADSLLWMKSKTCTKQQKEAAVKFFYAVRNRKEFLWNLESSRQIALQFKNRILNPYNLETIKNKLLLFSELTSQAEKLSKYSIHSNNGKTAKKVLENNKELLDSFNNGEISELSSCLSLTLGLNMIGCNWAIFESYSGSKTNAKQKVGRMHRLDNQDVANIIIIRPLNTQMGDAWYDNAFEWVEDYTVINNINELKI